MMMVFLILMIFGSKKVSSLDVLKYYSDKFVLEHYEEATGMVGLWESEKVVFQRSIQNKCAQLLEIGCGTGRISYGLSQLGYAKITATDFSKKMIIRAKELNEKYKTKIDFQKQDATALTFEECQFGAVIFGFNGLMQIPGELNRRKAMEESYRVLIPGGYFIFTAHDRSLPKWKKFWAIERKKWREGKQDPKLLEFGDRFEETTRGMLYIHVTEVDKLRAELKQVGFAVEGDFLRSKIANESERTKKYSDECRFWICRKPI